MAAVIKIGLENNPRGRSQAWALDYPGCFAYGKDGGEALLNVPAAVLAYQDWLGRHAPDSWLKDLGDFDVRLAETWEVYCINQEYEIVKEGSPVESFFHSEWKPLNVVEVRRAALLLRWEREDLLRLVQDLGDAKLDQTYPGERWSIRGILAHVGGAEWWYQQSLGLEGIPEAQLPQNVFDRLKVTRARTLEVLPDLAGQEKVWGREGELWSPRKMLRRAIWQELDHIEHIRKLILINSSEK
jgi:hypothetical protein